MGWRWQWRMNRTIYWPSFAFVTAVYACASYFQVKGGFNEIMLVVLAVPRLHDIGKSGWWAGGVFLTEIVLVTASVLLLPREFAMTPLAIFVVIVFGLLIWLGTIPGQPEANKYGEPPRFAWRRRARS